MNLKVSRRNTTYGLLWLTAFGFRLESKAAEKWEIQYQYEKNDSALTVTDFKFPSGARGFASGFISTHVNNLILGDREKTAPVVLITSDSGRTWAEVSVKEIANSLFFVDDSTGWLVGEDGLWMTTESGRSWKRICSIKNLLQVYFLSRTHGFAVGSEGRALETRDAGVTWKPISVTGAPSTSKDSTVYRTIAFSGLKEGIIAGDRHRRETLRKEFDEDEHDSLVVTNCVLTTKDGGQNWDASMRSTYGVMTRASLADSGFGLTLFEFRKSYPWPSEVYRWNMTNGDARRIYRETDHALTDVLLFPKGDALLAGYQLPGRVHPSPIPGKVRILHSDNLAQWEEMRVDYRATGRRVWLAMGAPGEIWAATDTGMILKLREH